MRISSGLATVDSSLGLDRLGARHILLQFPDRASETSLSRSAERPHLRRTAARRCHLVPNLSRAQRSGHVSRAPPEASRIRFSPARLPDFGRYRRRPHPISMLFKLALRLADRLSRIFSWRSRIGCTDSWANKRASIRLSDSETSCILTLDHHDGVASSCHHHVELALSPLFRRGVGDELAVDVADADAGNRTVPDQVGNGDRRRRPRSSPTHPAAPRRRS